MLHGFMLGFFILICIFAVRCNVLIRSLDIYDDIKIDRKLVNAMILVSAFLQVPLTFYQAKEFVLTLYDEILNKSLSKKIYALQRTTSDELYQQETVKKVRK